MDLTEQMSRLKLHGMQAQYKSFKNESSENRHEFDELLQNLLDAEENARDARKYTLNLKFARLRHESASPENIEYDEERNISKERFERILDCSWIDKGERLIISGPTGVGKTWISCAIAKQACLKGYTCQFIRFHDIFMEFESNRAKGTLKNLLKRLSKFDLMIVDDFGIYDISDAEKVDLYEFAERRLDKSIIYTSQMHPDMWSDYMKRSHPTIADAIMDRIVTNARSITLKGPSKRSRI